MPGSNELTLGYQPSAFTRNSGKQSTYSGKRINSPYVLAI